MQLIIRPDGLTECVENPAFLAGLGLQVIHRRRASHVLPSNPLLRLCFRALRRMYGEHGRIADWGRRWQCKWIVDLAPSGGPLLGVFNQRDDAIRAEVEWLENSMSFTYTR